MSFVSDTVLIRPTTQALHPLETIVVLGPDRVRPLRDLLPLPFWHAEPVPDSS